MSSNTYPNTCVWNHWYGKKNLKKGNLETSLPTTPASSDFPPILPFSPPYLLDAVFAFPDCHCLVWQVNQIHSIVNASLAVQSRRLTSFLHPVVPLSQYVCARVRVWASKERMSGCVERKTWSGSLVEVGVGREGGEKNIKIDWTNLT